MWNPKQAPPTTTLRLKLERIAYISSCYLQHLSITVHQPATVGKIRKVSGNTLGYAVIDVPPPAKVRVAALIPKHVGLGKYIGGAVIASPTASEMEAEIAPGQPP